MKKTHELRESRRQSEKLFGLLRVERVLAQRQEASVPKGLSQTQVCEWLTRGCVTSAPAASRIATDEALLASEAGAQDARLAPAPRPTSATVYTLPRIPRLTLAPAHASLAA